MTDFSGIKGFNYFLKPDYSFSSWIDFDPDRAELELTRAKSHFPVINTIRVQLSWDVHNVHPERYFENFESILCIADRLGLQVIPTLFSRCPAIGNIYADHFMPGWNWFTIRAEGHWSSIFDAYLSAFLTTYGRDNRINIWDLCNEPFPFAPGSYGQDQIPTAVKHIEQGEYEWLRRGYELCKSMGPDAPIGISVLQDFGRQGLERVDAISDILLIHPYFVHDQDNEPEKTAFLRMLDDYSALSVKVGKPLVATETCWPSVDDDWHVSNIRFTLSELKKRKIGWIGAKLHQSPGGREELPGEPIRSDGSLRPGHDVFNGF